MELDFVDLLFYYGDYMRYGINTIHFDVCIPNDIFHRINDIKLKSDIHKTLVFSFYTTLLMTNSFINKNYILNYEYTLKPTMGDFPPDNVNQLLISNAQLKELWHYSPQNKELDYIIKQNGIMDNAGLTEFLKKGYKHISYRADLKEGNYFRIPYSFIFYCINFKELGSVPFTLYCLILRAAQLKQIKENEGVALAFNYFKGILDLANDTIINGIKSLEKYGMLKVERDKVEDDYGDWIGNEVNKYYPVKEIPIHELSDDYKGF